MYNQSPYEIYNGQIGVRVSYLVADSKRSPVQPHENSVSVSSYWAIAKKADRTSSLRLREGRGAANEALIKWVEMPHDWREKCKAAFGDPEREAVPTLLEKHYQKDPKAADFYANWKRLGERNLEYKHIVEYTANASMLNAVIATMANRKALRKALGGSTTGIWETIYKDVEMLREKIPHTLKVPSLKRTLAAYKKEGYVALISGKLGNQNTAKLKHENQIALLEELLKKHNNFDNERVAEFYNMAASKVGWDTISSSTVANKRRELGLYIEAGRRGLSAFRNSKSMQVKRSRPSKPLLYWTLDGWDAELLFQKTARNKKGHHVTTYHNRLTAVVVLDPNENYPIGYAIGKQESPELIREALRNAINHTKELFGQRYKPWQLQSDHYGNGALTPIYEAMSEYYTPARVKNAKAKRIEPYFKELNRSMQMLPNWSGYGVTVNPDKQPNSEYLNKIRHSFPDEAGCRLQITHAIEMKRAEVRDAFLANWEAMDDADRLVCDTEDYLGLFGQITGFTNRLHHYGLQLTVDGEEYTYDTFDLKFRELAHLDWCVKFDPEDMSQVLAVDAKSLNNKLVEEVNTHKFLLEQKHNQPMALKDRKDSDAVELTRVNQFNKQLEDELVERGRRNMEHVSDLLELPEMKGGTLSKLMIVDSTGQHKDQRNAGRLAGKAKQIAAKQERQRLALQERQQEREERLRKEEFLDNKVNVNDYL